jgi:hypothetical protein
MKPLAHCKTIPAVYRRIGVRLPLLAAALTLLASLSGCAGLPPDLAAGGDVTLERTDSRSAHVGRVRVWAADSVLRVSGTLARPDRRRGQIPGHLHIEAIGDEGALLARTTTAYQRRSVKARQARFSAALPVDPLEVRKIRVIHHGLSHESC